MKKQRREAEPFLKCRCSMKFLLILIMQALHCWQDRMVWTPCSWFSTFHTLSSCSPSLQSTFLFFFFFHFIATAMSSKLHSPSPYLIPKPSCCRSFWNQSRMPDPREAAGQRRNSDVSEMKAPACLSQPLCEWWAPQMRHCDSKNS